MDLTSLNCPFCKKRISNWCRKAKNVDSLIDKNLWTRIQKDFENEVRARQDGTATTLFDEGGFSHDFVFEDGAIGKEFEEQMKQIRAEEQSRRDKELVESRKLIEAIQLEELGNNLNGNLDNKRIRLSENETGTKKLEAQIEQQKKDEELARRLQSEDEVTNNGGNSPGVSTRKTPMRPSENDTGMYCILMYIAKLLPSPFGYTLFSKVFCIWGFLPIFAPSKFFIKYYQY